MGNETVTLKLPSGENVDFVVPGGMSDSEVKTFVLSKRPDLFQSPGGTPPSDAATQSKQQFMSQMSNLMSAGGHPELANARPSGASLSKGGQPAQEPDAQGTLNALPWVGGGIAAGMTGGASIAAQAGMAALGGGAGSLGQQTIEKAAGQRQSISGGEATMKGIETGASQLVGGALGKYIVSPAMKVLGGSLGKAAEALQGVRGTIGKAPVDVAAPGEVALKARTLQQLTRDRLPTVIQGFLARATDPGQGPLTFAEARDLYQKAGTLAASERNGLSGIMQKHLQEFRVALGDSIQKTANGMGQGKTFSSAMQNYHDAKVAQDHVDFSKELMLEMIKKAAVKGAEGAGLGAGGAMAYKAIASKK